MKPTGSDCDHLDLEGTREYFNTKIENVLTLIAGNDANYKTQFANAKESVTVALLAQEKAVGAAFIASEKAIEKAEGAQKDYNNRSNEFRGQLDDQAKTLMPRVETAGLFKNVDEKISTLSSSIDEKLAASKISNEKVFEAIIKEIAGLRESRSEGVGKGRGANDFWAYLVAGIGVVATILAIASRF